MSLFRIQCPISNRVTLNGNVLLMSDTEGKKKIPADFFAANIPGVISFKLTIDSSALVWRKTVHIPTGE